ncbi:MAG: sigma-70 family RNA polymerase sigma factor [Acidobacteria bacterium]|nr:sigma-70 family RNA polymerase sigma factor [Acidobacteriota bacterium]
MEDEVLNAPGVDPGALESADQVLLGEVEPKGKLALVDRKQLARLDPLRRYLLEISKYEPLTLEEEQKLTRLFSQSGDAKIGVRLVTANLRLVVRIAMLYHRVYSNIMDLIQEGNVGLIQAVKHYDPDKGARLPTYAGYWIKAFIIKFILDNYRIVKVGTTNDRRKLLFNLRREKDRLRAEGFDPTPQLLAQRLDVKEADVIEVEAAINSADVSLEDPVGEEGEMRVMDRLAGAEEMIDDQIARGQLKEILNEKLSEFARALGERDRVILFERLVAEQPKTLQQIANRYQVTREAIRVAEKKVLGRLREYMRDQLAAFRDVDFSVK